MKQFKKEPVECKKNPLKTYLFLATMNKLLQALFYSNNFYIFSPQCLVSLTNAVDISKTQIFWNFILCSVKYI